MSEKEYLCLREAVTLESGALKAIIYMKILYAIHGFIFGIFPVIKVLKRP